LLPPLIVSDEELSEGIERLHRACRNLEAKHA
jgi:acetylornithine/succinyldiaminopimelate/putrescine aminotransferase